MDYIHIEHLKVRGKHGVGEEERKVEQEFEISVRLGVGSTVLAAKNHKLSDAVDYQPVKEMIVRVVGNSSHYLIETLAEIIAENILADRRILSAEVTIKKHEVWSDGLPGITITRTR